MNITILPKREALSFSGETITGLDLMPSQGKNAKKIIAMKVNGQLRDLSDSLYNNDEVEFLGIDTSDGVHIARHSCAHLFGHAIKQLYPDAQMAIGPVIENGFYYDIKLDKRLNEDDLKEIESRMKLLARTNYQVIKEWKTKQQAKSFFQDRKENYKVKLLDDMPDSVEKVALYHHQEYTDMCIGPHVPKISMVGAFKLTKLSGAYWRGNSQNEMLQRIYGTSWANEKELKKYINFLEEAEKRDHRTIAKRMNLFHLQEEAPGMVFWHPNGMIIYNSIIDYMRSKNINAGYEEIKTPEVLDKSLWLKSGHWDKFRDNMFFTSFEDRQYAVKPMNCPGCIQIYNNYLYSYRNLPLRFSEFGRVHRLEPSGTLHGLMRVRAFTQDDAHIFCTTAQLKQEVLDCINLIIQVYNDFGFSDILIKVSTRPDNRIGSDEVWDLSENSLKNALNSAGYDWEEMPGEGAFYGPKIEFSLRDCIGRIWQCGTVQVDFNMPERLGAQYIESNGQKETPVIIHRAILGSLERFIGILIEHFAGSMPLWLSPVQFNLMNITSKTEDYMLGVANKLKELGARIKIDNRNEKINYKIREATLAKHSYILIFGEREKENQEVSIRIPNGDNQTISVANLLDKAKKEIQKPIFYLV